MGWGIFSSSAEAKHLDRQIYRHSQLTLALASWEIGSWTSATLGRQRQDSDLVGASLMDLQPATLSDLFWEYALAETQNDERHDRMYSRGLGPELFLRVRANKWEELTPKDWDRLRATVEATRPDYVSPLLSLDLSWKVGWIETEEIPMLRTPGLNIFRPFAPSRGLAEFATSLQTKRALSSLAVERNFWRMVPRFDPTRMLGAPVVIGKDISGPFTIVEGMTRLSVLCARVKNAESVPPRIRIVVGLGTRAREWPFF